MLNPVMLLITLYHDSWLQHLKGENFEIIFIITNEGNKQTENIVQSVLYLI